MRKNYGNGECMKTFFRYTLLTFAVALLQFSCLRLYAEASVKQIFGVQERGMAYENEGDFPSAIEEYKKELALLEQYNGNAEQFRTQVSERIGGQYKGDETYFKAELLNHLGQLNEQVSSYKEAIQNYTAAQELYDQFYNGADSIDKAACLNNIANVYESLDRYEEALEFYTRSERIIKNVDGDESYGLAFVYLGKSVALHHCDRSDEALAYINMSLKLFEFYEGPDSKALGYVYSTMSSIYEGKGDNERGLIFAEKALKIAEETDPSPYNLITFYDNYAHSLETNGDFVGAMNYYVRIINLIASGQVFTEGSIHALIHCATMFSELGEHGSMHYVMKEPEVAEPFSTLCNTFNEKEMKASIKTFYPEYTGIKTPYDFSLVVYKMALFLSEYVYGNDKSGVGASCYNAMGVIYSYTNEYKTAIENFQKSLSIYKKIFGESHPKLGHVYFNCGNAYIHQGNAKEAVAYWKKAFTSWETSADYEGIINDIKYILSVEEKIADTAFIKQALSVGMNAVERSRLDSESFKAGVLKNALPIFYYAVAFYARQKDFDAAFEYAEAMKSRGFLDQMGTEAALNLDGITEEERDLVHGLIKQNADLKKRIQLEASAENADGEEERLQLAVELSASEKQLKDVDAKIAGRIPRYGQLRNLQTESAKNAKAWCPKDSAVLEYVLWSPDYAASLGDAVGKSYCIVLRNGKISLVELDSGFDYAAAVNSVRNGIMPTNVNKKGEYVFAKESSYEKARNSLYAKLIEPVIPYIKGVENILIVPDGNLAFLPFDILRKKSSSPMLCKDYAVMLSPSVSVSMLVQKGTGGQDNVLAFGGAWYDRSLSEAQHRASFSLAKLSAQDRKFSLEENGVPPVSQAEINQIERELYAQGVGMYFLKKKIVWRNLPGTLLEVEALSDGVFAHSPQSFLQERASEGSLKTLSASGELRKFNVLHFACHGYFDSTIAEMCSVVFAEVSGKLTGTSNEDGYLTVPEVSLLNLNADIVCLSACETGLGEVRAGDGLVGLSRGFMVAGARNVGVSLWAVDDSATAEFMVRMYKKQQQGMTYMAAYRAVKNEFVSEKKWAHPFYWAAFTLFGGL